MRKLMSTLLPFCLLEPATGLAGDADGLRTVELGTVRVTASASATLDERRRAWPVRVLDAEDLDRMQAVDIAGALNRRVPGVSLNNVQGNPLQPDLQYRGFAGSPLLGTPQGLAVYFDGVRVNEAFGDTVNWDLLPLQAIERIDVIAGADPVFGLNTLGGAISLRGKDGFSSPGTQLDYEAGSFSRQRAALQSGGNDGRFGWYLLADDLHDGGWRDLSSSDARHYFGNFGWRGERGSLDLGLIHARSELTGNGAAPVELLEQRYAAVFTAPDETANTLDQASLRGGWRFDDDITLDATVFARNVRTRAYNGDVGSAEPCPADPSILCADDSDAPVLDQHGEPVPSEFDAVNNIGVRRQRARGESLQLTFGRPWHGRDNQLVLGIDAQRGTVEYASIVEPATLLENRHTSSGSGLEIPEEALGLHAATHSEGVYLTDTLSLTPTLSLTAALRWNRTRVVIADRTGNEPDLNGRHRFSRFNPALGLAWDLSPSLNLHAGYSESTRAPTPVELSCADEDAPCRLPNQFVADPPLEQVVARSWEAGLRGGRDESLRWQLGLFHTLNRDDILFQSTGGISSNEGFFANVADTLRRGIEAGAHGRLREGRLQWYANYVLLDAIFRDAFTESSANHPHADDEGLLAVRRGNRLPGLPRHQLKAGIDVDLAAGFSAGIAGTYRSGVYLRGDEANRLPRTGGYALFGVHARWRVTPRLSLHARIDNLFDRRHADFGVLGEPDEVFPDFDDPRFLGPGAPRGAWLGARLAL